MNVVKPFRRSKSGVLGCNSVRPHWGPGFAKFRIAAVQSLRLGLPSQRPGAKFAVGAHSMRLLAFPPVGGRWHGEVVTDEGAVVRR